MEIHVQRSRPQSGVLQKMERSPPVPSGLCNLRDHVSIKIRRMTHMAYFRTCEYCGGALDPGEKCDCRRLKNRNYTSIEGAGYAPKQIHPINYRNKKQTG